MTLVSTEQLQPKIWVVVVFKLIFLVEVKGLTKCDVIT